MFFLNLSFGSAYSIGPDVFVQSTVNRASQILSKNISKEEKINRLKIIAKETVDIKGIGFYSLGSARKNLKSIGDIKYIYGSAPGRWDRYAIHLIDTLLMILDNKFSFKTNRHQRLFKRQYLLH